jgi:hypothetical protein
MSVQRIAFAFYPLKQSRIPVGGGMELIVERDKMTGLPVSAYGIVYAADGIEIDRIPMGIQRQDG